MGDKMVLVLFQSIRKDKVFENNFLIHVICIYLNLIKNQGLTPLSTIFQLYVAVCFIGGGNWSTRRKPLTCRKSLTNFIT